jgi:hypothetical protein
MGSMASPSRTMGVKTVYWPAPRPVPYATLPDARICTLSVLVEGGEMSAMRVIASGLGLLKGPM